MDTVTATQNRDHALRERLMGSLHDVVTEGEALLKTAQRSGNEQFVAARDKFESRLREARSELAGLQDTAAYNMRRAARVTDTAVHQHPYVTAGLGAGLGLLVGLLVSRR